MEITAVLYFLRKGSKLHFTVWVPFSRKICGVSRGVKSLGSGFPIGARSIPVGTRFCLQSLVCYTLYLRVCEKLGTGILVAGFEADKKSFVSVPVSVTEVKLFD